MKRILGIGNALVDVMTMIPGDHILSEFGLPKGSMQLVDYAKSEEVKMGTKGLKQSLASGGSAANTIHGLARLGSNSGYIGSVGRDETGEFFEKDMHKAGAETYLFRRTTETGTAVALVSPDSERTFATHLGAATELSAGDLKKEHFEPYQIFYLEGYLINNKPLVERACQLAKENNMEIAIDLSSYNVVEAHLDDFRDIIGRYVDIIFANEEEAKAFTGMEPAQAIEQLAKMCKISIVKVGKEGSLIKRGEEFVKVGSLNADCVDTTGAGDLYAAGFLYGYANDLPLDKCGIIGSILAGNVIENIGARITEKRWSAIKKAIVTETAD